ncbi:4Fe-4S dicluster domain-containing protein [Carboxydothermus hydrogenoformans]|uniref:Putative keto/oxoacid ferredoxin oxidoreductase, delta subunit n=1 Tax=Carboxydothermus hydrogenoformans (strain ATCC BAA-161 / DSM 6008 / Z-2901) TaxID=246194 RepID=Q3ACJ0_CARHZ|nr:ferredoxin family protein [Carboxydothermus hydrogenoformans]ABB15614.1 putative keto/oxoacid ferredoxin oxidoreductase, delta subunit [Carboxydothermus hydrogenoformans Z-2901]
MKVTVDYERCKGCGLCIDVCPKKIIYLNQDFNSKGYYYATISNIEECIGCGRCYQICPDLVFEVKEEAKING